MAEIRFKIAARTDVGVVRDNNEDNFQASADLTQQTMTWVNNEKCTLGDKGALLVVADGMGGMNAGEVASEIAINTVKDLFTPEKLSDESIFKSDDSIESYLKFVIKEADERIKKEAEERPETQGMGTTIVMAWLYTNKLYVAWCGDSRAYVYNPAFGLIQISKDHSYVQELVDKKKLTREEAFDFPQSNIITRCLSASVQKAIPEVLKEPYKVCNGDVILLCSDGLSGLIRDEEISNLLEEYSDNLSDCVSALISAACDAGGHDNITVAMCKIISGGEKNFVPPYNPHAETSILKERKKGFRYIVCSIVVLLLVLICGMFFFHNEIKHCLSNLLVDNIDKENIVEQERDSLTAMEEVIDSISMGNTDVTSSLSQILSESSSTSSTKVINGKNLAAQVRQIVSQKDEIKVEKEKLPKPSLDTENTVVSIDSVDNQATRKVESKPDNGKSKIIKSRGLFQIGNKKYHKVRIISDMAISDIAKELNISSTKIGKREGDRVVCFTKEDSSLIIQADEVLYYTLNDEE